MEDDGRKDNTTDILTMKDVELIAVRTISKFKPGTALSRDNVDKVAAYVWKAYTTHDPSKSKLMTWLISSAKLMIKNLDRRQSNKYKILSLDKLYPSKLGQQVSLHDFLGRPDIDKPLINEVFEYIKNTRWLSEKQKIILVAHYKENRPIIEIATELGVSRAYVYYLLNRAIEKLKLKFAER